MTLGLDERDVTTVVELDWTASTKAEESGKRTVPLLVRGIS